MEVQDPNGDEKRERAEVGQRDGHVVPGGTKDEGLASMALKQIKKEPEEEEEVPHQSWETQWQGFLKTLQTPYLGRRFPHLPSNQSGEGPKEHQASLKDVTEPSGQDLSQALCGLTRDAHKAYETSLDFLVKVKEEIPDDDAISLEERRQRFRNFCYCEADGPRDVCRQLQELCSQWLKPERCTKQQILEQVTLEQFLTILPKEVQSWVRDGGPETCVQAVALAEDFLLRLKRGDQEELEPFEEVIVNSPKMEQDLPDFEEMHLSMDLDKDSDREANLFGKNETKPLQPERPKSLKARRIFMAKSMEKISQDSVLSGSEKEEQNLQPQRSRKADVNEISLERAGRTHIHLPEIDTSLINEQELRQPQENSLGKVLGRNMDCREEDSLHLNKSPSQESITEYMLREKATNCEESFAPCLDPVLPAKAPSYKCSYCGKQWPCQSQLRRHIKIHTGEKPHKCTDCGKSFSTSSNLSQHKRVHTDERPYSCKDCGKSYRRRASLLQHERETCRKGSHLNPLPAMGYVVLGNCTLLCMKKATQGGRNRMIAPKGGEAPLAAQPLNILTENP
ncbi:zinc finger protein with KRAB and SCAN domains 1-like [Sceloporus undulatus]|uniref:zinc finger protein with KRAB and SCAN domains 1-like n=1 Tax=Sceloporus undulatus TaxID=8520 RepID=UPI001C4C4AE6|nr:zinc finger protein with KRAB and SCAN domains 1-like [Sceloporus undulatus]